MTKLLQRAVLSSIVLFSVNINSFPVSDVHALMHSEPVYAGEIVAERVTVNEEEWQAEQSQEKIFKNRVVELVNIEREKHGVAPLVVLDQLVELADTRAEEAAQKWSHTRPNGQSWTSIFDAYRLDYRKAGENLACGMMSPETTVRAWMASPSHRENILHPAFEYIGIGYHEADGSEIYVSQLFYLPMEPVAREDWIAKPAI